MVDQTNILQPYKDLLREIERKATAANAMLLILPWLLIIISFLLVAHTLNPAFLVLWIIGAILLRVGRPIRSRYRMPKNALPFGKVSEGALKGLFCYFNNNGVYVHDNLYANWSKIADVQVIDNSSVGSIKIILKNGAALWVSQVPYPDRLAEYLKKRYLSQGTEDLSQPSPYQSMQQAVPQPAAPQPPSAPKPIQPVVLQGDILWPYRRRRDRINTYRRIGYALIIIGLILVILAFITFIAISIPFRPLFLVFIPFGPLFLIVGIILAATYRIPKDTLPISLPVEEVIGHTTKRRYYLMGRDGVYRGRELVFKWSDVVDVQLVTLDEETNEGLVRFAVKSDYFSLKSGYVMTIDIPRTIYPVNLVEYVKRTYLGQKEHNA